MDPTDRFRLDGRVALVTGGGQGIGRAVAIAIADAGADVVIADVNEHTGPTVASEIQAIGRRSLFVHTDVTDESAVRNVVARTVRTLGGLHIAVNGAWVGGRAGASRRDARGSIDMPLEEWDFVHDLLLRATFLCCREEALAMRESGGGRIVNIASISAVVANASAAYTSAKAGVVGLTRQLAAEWGGYNINVNAISPSYTLSPARRSDTVADRDLIRSLHPMGWYERPDDLAGTAVFLASEASSFLTGQNLVVDGGHTLNAWLGAPARHVEPRVGPEEEVGGLIHDLDVIGMEHDEQGVVPS